MISLIFGIALQFAVMKEDGRSDAAFYPVRGGRVTSPFGSRIDPLSTFRSFHTGIDIGVPAGTPIYSIGSGQVTFSGEYLGFGNLVVVQHGKDITTHYAHCWETKVKVGQIVSSSTVLGFVGRSGRATGPHLHFEVRYHGIPVNPEWILSEKSNGYGKK